MSIWLVTMTSKCFHLLFKRYRDVHKQSSSPQRCSSGVGWSCRLPQTLHALVGAGSSPLAWGSATATRQFHKPEFSTCQQAIMMTEQIRMWKGQDTQSSNWWYTMWRKDPILTPGKTITYRLDATIKKFFRMCYPFNIGCEIDRWLNSK